MRLSIALSDSESHPHTVVEGFGSALDRSGYPCEFIVVLDGPVARFEEELREPTEIGHDDLDARRTPNAIEGRAEQMAAKAALEQLEG